MDDAIYEETVTDHNPRSLESRLSQLQASLDEALEHVKVSGHPVASVGLQDLTRQIAQQIETCKTGSQFHPQIKATRPDSPAKAVSGGDGVRIAQLQLTSSCNIASPQNSESITNDIHQTTQSRAQIAPLPLSKIQTFELLDYFRYEVESIYSFIQLDCLTSLADVLLDSSTTTSDSSMNMQTEEWGDTFDGRNLDLLMLLLACALTSKQNKECEVSHEMTNIVREKLSIKMKGSEFDLKDIAVATLLVSFVRYPLVAWIIWLTFRRAFTITNVMTPLLRGERSVLRQKCVWNLDCTSLRAQRFHGLQSCFGAYTYWIDDIAL